MNIVRYIIIFIIMLLFQVFIGRNLVMMGTAFCFAYVLFFLVLPVDMSKLLTMALAFAMGLLVDMAYNTGGMHAAASVFIMFFRDKWLNAITPQGGYDGGAYPSLKIGGISWFSAYALPIIFIHHVILFFLESYGFSFFWFTLSKAILSTIFTYIICIAFLAVTSRSFSK